MIMRYHIKFNKLEQVKNQLLGRFENLNPEILTEPNVGKWSALQHCYHLHLAEKSVVAYLNKKLSFSPELADAGFQTTLRRLALIFVMKAPFKAKAPVFTSESEFPNELSLQSLQSEWSETRNALKAFLDRANDNYLNKELFNQANVGRITLDDTLLFMILHQNRHLNHIKKHIDL